MMDEESETHDDFGNMDHEKAKEQLEELIGIKNYVEEQKASGNQMFVSAWDDDNEGVEDALDLSSLQKDKPKHIMWAAENGELGIVKKLLAEDPSLIGATDRDGYSPLHRASYNNHVQVVEFLLRSGANCKAVTNDGWTPLHSAAHWNNALVAVRLIEGGADVNAKTNGGQTPLHLAAAHGASKDTLELLLLHPLIKPHETNNLGETPQVIAARSGVFAKIFTMFDPCFSLGR